jgi:hypothetical protein
VVFEIDKKETETTLAIAFTYPYSYENLQSDLTTFETEYNQHHQNQAEKSSTLYYKRDLLVLSPEGRRVDLITITSNSDKDSTSASIDIDANIPFLFPALSSPPTDVPTASTSRTTTRASPANKEILFISARVHPGEVPASHTFKGIFDLLTDLHDVRAIELRNRYVFKLVPMINPDGVFRGTAVAVLSIHK